MLAWRQIGCGSSGYNSPCPLPLTSIPARVSSPGFVSEVVWVGTTTVMTEMGGFEAVCTLCADGPEHVHGHGVSVAFAVVEEEGDMVPPFES